MYKKKLSGLKASFSAIMKAVFITVKKGSRWQMKKRIRMIKKAGAVFAVIVISAALLAGCGSSGKNTGSSSGSEVSGRKTFVYGDTTFNAENGITDVNPHNQYSGWACIRYGIGETLFKYSDSMEPEPWLATEYKNMDPLMWKFRIRKGVKFTSGRKLDAQAVKECFSHLVKTNTRAKSDLKIKSMKADGQTLIITTKERVPAFINYISDPYACIIDMKAGISDQGNVSGTGPYRVTELETDKGLTLVKNKEYWAGTPKLDEIQVKTITDGDTMTMSMQSGELDAAYGLPYSSLALFQNSPYTVSSCATSRTFYLQMNENNQALNNRKVREAVAAAIDKKSFVSSLMEGNGYTAEGPFPSSLSFGDSEVRDVSYNIARAKKLLKKAGYTDTDGDGYVDKNGKNLTFRWLTYPSRQELPLLAESAQATLKEAGIRVEINATANTQDYLKKGAWDIYAGAIVTAPTGDPEYFFKTMCLDGSVSNYGNYHSDRMEKLEKQMAGTLDEKERSRLGVKMSETLLKDHAFVFVSHLKMSIVSGEGVTGLKAHPSDYYEITSDLDKE